MTNNERAFIEELFREFFQPVRNFFVRRGCSPDLAEELAQETFLRAHRASAEFRGDAKRLTWLLTIATNVWRNHRRDTTAAKRAGHEISIQNAEQKPAPDTPPQEQLIDQERRQLLESAIGDLPPKMRRCVLLRVYQNRSFRDIADLLGITEGTAKSQLSLAKGRLRSIFAEHYPDLGTDFENWDRQAVAKSRQ